MSNSSGISFKKSSKYLVRTLASITLLTMIGCGGGDSSSSSDQSLVSGLSQQDSKLINGQFIDGPVSGLNYICSSGISSVTDGNGAFSCLVGDIITFRVGNVLLGSAMAASVITPVSLYPKDSISATRVAQLLQTLDDDGNLDSFVIDQDKANFLHASLDITADNFQINAETMLLESLVEASDAITHLNTSIIAMKDNKLPLLEAEVESGKIPVTVPIDPIADPENGDVPVVEPIVHTPEDGAITAQENSSPVINEKVINGFFNDTSAWYTSGGWVISGGKVNDNNKAGFEATSQYLLNIDPAATYKVTYTVSNATAGGVRIKFNNTYINNYSPNGTYTLYTAGGSKAPQLALVSNPDFDGSVDNVSVVPSSEETIVIEVPKEEPTVTEPIVIISPDPIASDEFKLTAPAHNAVLFRQRKLVVSIAPSTNIVRVEYWADKKTISLGSTSDFPFSLDFDTSVLSNGVHTIQAFAYDASNAQLSSQEITVRSHADSFKNAKEYHVSPTGSVYGNGSINSPWDADTMFNSPLINPGDIVWMHGGNYDNASETKIYMSRLFGTEAKPILLRAYGDGAVDIHVKDGIDGYGNHTSAWNWFWGFEPSISRPERDVGATGYRRPPGLYLTNRGHKVINCIVSNNGHPGVGNWSGIGDTGEIYGTIIWGTGIYDIKPQPYIRGSGIYAQNEKGTRYFRDVISFRNFTNGIKPYTENTYASGFHLEGDVAFQNYLYPIAISSINNPVERTKLINNYTYQEANTGKVGVTVGVSNVRGYNNQIEIRGNYFVGGGSPQGAFDSSVSNNLTFTNNTLVSQLNSEVIKTPRLFKYIPTTTQTNVVWNNNKYFGGGGGDNLINNYSNSTTRNYLTSFSAWKSVWPTFDKESTYTRSLPTENSIFVRPNLYERGRGHVIIYNWKGLSYVDADISSLGLEEGENFEVRDVQNFYGTPIFTGKYSNSNRVLSLPMNLTTISPTVGNVTHMNDMLKHTSTKFGVFIILKK